MLSVMDRDELMTIGQFARLSGVSPHALRHYDDVSLLLPFEVDAHSGYRRYRRAQIQTARLIQALRNLGLPIEEVREIVGAPTDEEVTRALSHHRTRLERERRRIDTQIRHVDRYLEEGISMPVVQSGCRPVQIKLAVDDVESSVAFYQQAFGLNYEVARRTQHHEGSAFVFSEYGQADFFLLWLLDDAERFDRPGTSNFSLLVDDVDQIHTRALSAGATEVFAPRDLEGMPRNSTVKDPSGNWIGLAQG
jgi:DNA-binding transcriptional MerR regulator